jgi:hypothetical protein
MDVQPSNIIILPGVDGNLTVLLIDWGCGALRNKNLTYYKGCPPFSHDDLLYTTETKIISKKPLPEYDEFSLAMTICYLLKNGMPWDGFNRPQVTQAMLDTRKNKALSLIKASTRFSKEIKNRLLLIVNPPQVLIVNPPQRKRQDKNSEGVQTRSRSKSSRSKRARK